MKTAIRDVMSTDLVTCPGSAPVAEAARLMRDRNIGDVIVTDGEQLTGIVTDRDIVVRCLADGDISRATLSDACSPELKTVTPDDRVEDAARLMAERAIRRLLVVEDGRAVGIVSIGDLAAERDPHSALGGISAAPPNR
jgi:CBS domain-containing protein